MFLFHVPILCFLQVRAKPRPAILLFTPPSEVFLVYRPFLATIIGIIFIYNHNVLLSARNFLKILSHWLLIAHIVLVYKYGYSFLFNNLLTIVLTESLISPDMRKAKCTVRLLQLVLVMLYHLSLWLQTKVRNINAHLHWYSLFLDCY